jgi:hypothetical protein
MGNLWNTWLRALIHKLASPENTCKMHAPSRRSTRKLKRALALKLENLEDRSVPALMLTNTSLDFGSDPQGVVTPYPQTTTVLNSDPNNILLSVTPSGANAGDFAILSGPGIGQPLGTAPRSFQFGFRPSTQGAESADYSIVTTDGTLIVALAGTGTSSVALSSPNLDFGSLPVGTSSPSVRSTSILNVDPNNVLLGITASGPNANDFPVVLAPPVGQPLTTTPQTLRFEFTPTTAGSESAFYTLTTTDGILTVPITGTGTTSTQPPTPSLNHSSVSFGNVPQGVAAPALGAGLFNFVQGAQLLSVTSNSPQAADFPLVTPITVGQTLPVATSSSTPSLNLQFGFIPSTTAAETATYTIATTAGNVTVTLSGTGISPLSLNHSSVSFGNVPQGVGAPPLGVGLFNLGRNVQLLSVTSNSPQAADFPLLTPITIGQPIPIATSSSTPSLSLQFGFIPSTTAAETATYTIATTAGNLTVTLSGAGISPVTLARDSIDFGSSVVGNAAPPLSVGVWNFGRNVQVLGVTSSGPQAADFPLLTPLSPGQVLQIAQPVTPTSVGAPSLTLQFGFVPSTVGSESATYTIATTAGELTLNLTGTGTTPISLSPTTLDFGSIPVGNSTNGLGATLQNLDPRNFLLSVATSGANPGDFHLVAGPPIGQPLGVGAPQFFFVFTPSTVGAESAIVTFHTTDGDLTLNLTGTGTSPISLTPSSLDLGSSPVGDTGSAQFTTFQNLDPNNVVLSITASGANPNDFRLLGGPPVGQPLGFSSFEFPVVLIPSMVGAESATITFHTTDGDVALALSGTGTSPISLTPSTLDLGSSPVGVTSPWQQTTFLNMDPNNVLQSVTASGANPNDFQVLFGPPIGQPLGFSSFGFPIVFTPSVVGAESATITFQTTDGSVTLNLTGTGTSPISLTPSSLDFGFTPLGATSSAQSVTFQNLDPNNVVLSISTSGANPNDFQLFGGPPVGQPLGFSSFGFPILFTPSTIGAESASVTYQTTDGSVTLSLSGTGISPIHLDANSLNFGSDPVGVTSPSPRSTTLVNQDPNNVLLSITPSGANPNDFNLLSAPPVGFPLGVGQQLFQLAFTPSTRGPESATYTITTTDGSETVSLSGAGTSPIRLSPASLGFGSVPVGVTNPSARSTTLVNQDPNNVLLSITPGGNNPNDFALVSAPAVGSLLGVGQQTFQFVFTPSITGAESATFTITTTDGSEIVALSGRGVTTSQTATVSLSQTAVSFGRVMQGTPSQPQTVGLWNFGQGMQLLGVSSTSALAADFQLLTQFTPGEVLPVAQPATSTSPGVASLNLQFGFVPSTVGGESVTYTISTSAGNFNLTLSGTGTSSVSLSRQAMSFGRVAVGTPAQPLSVGVWNFGQGVQLLGVSSTSALAADFPLLTQFTPGEVLPVAQPATATSPGVASLNLQFGFVPSTVGGESVTYTISTSAGDITLTLNGTGTSSVSLDRASLNFGAVAEGTPAQPLSVGVWNFGQGVQLLGVSSTSALAADFPLLTQFTPGEVLPVAQPVTSSSPGTASLALQFGFVPSTLGAETVTYTISTSAGNYTLTLNGTGTSAVSLSQSAVDFGSISVGSASQVLSVGLWNFGQNVQLLGITSASPQAGDFQLVQPNPIPGGQNLAVAQPVSIAPNGPSSLELLFVLTPSTTGTETATFTIATTAGNLTLTLTGIGI